MRGFFLLVAFFLGCVLIVVLFSFGAGISARREAGQFERQASRAVWRFMVPGPIKIKENPVADSAETVRDATQLWVDRCVVCHANDGGGTTIGRSLHPPTPDLRKVLTQSLTDGELFYAIEQGIPLTGMPAWGDGSRKTNASPGRSSGSCATFPSSRPRTCGPSRSSCLAPRNAWRPIGARPGRPAARPTRGSNGSRPAERPRRIDG